MILISSFSDGVTLGLKDSMLDLVMKLHNCLLSTLHLSVLTQLGHVVGWTTQIRKGFSKW